MYAVVKTGGRQFKVAEGDLFTVEKLEGEVGAEIELSEVLMVGGDTPKIGAPRVADASVKVTIEKQFRGKKILVHKFKRRKNYQKCNGHRQPYTQLKVVKIQH